VTVSQQLGASIGTSLVNTIYATAIASYLVAHESSARFIGRAALNDLAVAHGYDIAFRWTCAIAAGGGSRRRRAAAPRSAGQSGGDHCGNPPADRARHVAVNRRSKPRCHVAA
jgi:hypothetical protein